MARWQNRASFSGKGQPYLKARYWRALAHGAKLSGGEPTAGMKGAAVNRELLTAEEARLKLLPFGGSRGGLSVQRHSQAEARFWKKRYQMVRKIGDRIRELRGDSLLRELATGCYMAESCVSALELGGGNPTVSTLLRVAEALGVELVVEFRPK